VSCDGYASPIDALLVINELNEPMGAPDWSFASDGDADGVRYRLVEAPPGATIDPRTGVVAWVASIEQLGPQRVVLQARNDGGGIASQDFLIDVKTPNTAPIIASQPPTQAFVGEAYRYDVVAQDAEQPLLAYSLLVAPAGEVSWQPTVAQLGAQSFSVRFTGPSGDSEDRQLAIEVREAAVNAPLGSYRVPRVWRQ